ncbi:uncharacterized protein LOC105282623 isoform X3 [Ooceraea biroi]|uniref:uncharacterized protein LOC105282623 isoform X3 n=1 Tax=Ooceraea biroi TaxID=2015173 RepID=UPI000F0985E8|nr:uncharacterized protein LOC105282623 isoform X3 [Ooceraea biroi]
MMVCIRKRFFNLNRLLLHAFGLWPDEQTIFARFRATMLCSLLISSIVFQLSRLFILEYSFDLIVRIVSSTTFFAMFTVAPFSLEINMKTIKHLFNQKQYIYDQLKDRNEIAIYDKYGYSGKHFTTIIIILLVCALCGDFVIVYWPYVLDIVVPKNESHTSPMIQFLSEYFHVSEKYQFLVLVHFNTAMTAGSIVFVGTTTMLFSYFLHICGMFEIARRNVVYSYRIEQAMAIELLHNCHIKNRIMIYRKMICAIDMQRQAMESVKYIVTVIDETAFVLAITTVVCMSCYLFRVFRIESPMERLEEVLVYLLDVSALLTIMFLGSYVGQEIIDHSNHVYVITYNVSWYLAPLHIQKLILFLLQRRTKSCTLSVGGLITASFECFATLVKVSMSYFTFMYSVQ